MLINLPGLKTLDILIMFIGCQRRYMGLSKPPRAWYEFLRDFLIEKGFTIGKVDTTLFTKKLDGEIFICQVYVDDIIFGSSNEDYCKEFGKLMSKEYCSPKMDQSRFGGTVHRAAVAPRKTLRNQV